MSGPGLRTGTVDAMTDDGIRARTFHDAVGADGWRLVSDGANAFYPTTSLAQSAALVAALGALESIDAHPPDIDIRPDGVTVKLLTVADDWYGPTQRDVDAARRISAVAAERGLVADPRTVAVDAHHHRHPGPGSGHAVLGGRPRVRAAGRQPGRGSGRSARTRSGDLVRDDRPPARGGWRIHLAVWLPPELAEARVEAALAAGGHLVRDTQAPTWWTLADGEGNEIDVSTVLHRD